MRVLIADDHGIVRSGLRLLLERQPDIEVVAEAADGAEAREIAVRERPDLAILDVKMPKLTGLQATREIKQQAPEVAILILSMHDDERYLFEALKAGASGYVLKTQADTDLLAAIRAVERGEPFLTPEAQQALIQDVLERGARRRRGADPARGGDRQARRRGPHDEGDRRDPPPLREDRREPPRQRDAKARHAGPRRAGPLRDPPRPDRALSTPEFVAVGDGEELLVRPISPGDKDRLAGAFDRLSPESRYRRFFAPLERLIRAGPPLPDRARPPRPRGVRRDRAGHGLRSSESPATSAPSDPSEAEVAVVVADPWQGRGRRHRTARPARRPCPRGGHRPFRRPRPQRQHDALELFSSLASAESWRGAAAPARPSW